MLKLFNLINLNKLSSEVFFRSFRLSIVVFVTKRCYLLSYEIIKKDCAKGKGGDGGNQNPHLGNDKTYSK